MAGDGLEFALLNYEETLNALKRMSAPELQELAEYIGEELLNISEKAFEDTADPVTGEKWDESERVKLNGGQTLTHSAQLRRSLTYEAFPDGSVLYGSNKIYARIHNKGGKAGRGKKVKIPQRRFLGIPDGFHRRLMDEPEVQDMLGLK